VKYPTVTSTPSETRMAIPRFMLSSAHPWVLDVIIRDSAARCP
jgi:hypothetical protein